MKANLIFAASVRVFLGCVSAKEAIIDSDAGESHAQRVPARPIAVVCADACDCFDDNACTTDTCIDGVCVNDPVDGGCGSTVGMCRGSSCCTGEMTCFIAYDNDSDAGCL